MYDQDTEMVQLQTTDFYTSIDTQSMVVYFNPTLVCLIGRQGDDSKQVIMTL